MLLVLDVGNTETVVGLLAGEALRGHWRVRTDRHRTADEYRVLIHELLGLDGFREEDLTGVAIASVVPTATDALRLAMPEVSGSPLVIVGPGTKTGMAIQIDNPREVGADRIVNAVAAARLHGVPAVVVDFGTSTNWDIVSAEGAYIGGVIATGVEVSAEALVARTAALRRVELAEPRSVIGKGTVEAIQSGSLYGHAGLVDGIMRRILAEVGAGAHVIATGGLAATIVPLCETVEAVDEFLTLKGLRIIFDMNQ
jgi:type III pantothenate kinase